MDKNRKILLVLICFLGAVIFFVTSIVSYKYDKKNETSKSGTETIEDTQEDINEEQLLEEYSLGDNNENTPTVLDSETIEKMKENADSDPLDENEIQDTTYNDEFKITELKEEILPFINNDLDGMKENIQKTLYENGYYAYTYAEFDDYVEIDYFKNTISIALEVKANVDVTVYAIYNRDTQTWITQIW